MRALVLNGALAGDEDLAPIEQAVSAALMARGWDVQCIHLRDLRIAYCKGCFQCFVKTPGFCPTNDQARDVTRALVRSDLLVLLSPITFGGYSSEIKKALDRSIGVVMPFFARIGGEVHHAARYAHYPAVLAIGLSDIGDAEEERAFSSLVDRNAINLHSPAHKVGILRRADPPEQMWSVVGRLVRDTTAAIDAAKTAASPSRRGAA